MTKRNYTLRGAAVSLLAVMALGAGIAGCSDGSDKIIGGGGGLLPGGGGGGAGGAGTTVSGTAATGAAVANAQISLKDANGIEKIATTDANGNYSIDITGLTSPFLIKLDLPAGGALFSTGGTGTVNVTPLTDVVVASYYSAKGTTATADFNNPTQIPSASEIDSLSSALRDAIGTWLADQGLDASGFDLFTTTFTANGNGFDAVLDGTTVTGGTTITITIGAKTQTTTITTNGAGGGSVTLTNTVTQGGSTSQSTTTVNLPTNATAQQTATNGVNTMLTNLLTAVNNKGTGNVLVSDLLPFFDAAYKNGGFTTNFDASGIIEDNFSNSAVTVAYIQIHSVDAFNDGSGTMTARWQMKFTEGGVNTTVVIKDAVLTYFKRQGDGTWKLFGDQLDPRVGTTALRPAGC